MAGEPRRVDLRDHPPGDVDPGPFVEHLRAGGILFHPTETVYGMGCVLEPEPLARLQRFKSRGPSSPFLLLVPGRESLTGLVWTAGASEMARVFWPGPLTLILADPGGRFPAAVRGARGGWRSGGPRTPSRPGWSRPWARRSPPAAPTPTASRRLAPATTP